MIINFTKDKDKYISQYIAKQSGDEIIDAKQKIFSKDKSPIFSEKPYVLVCDYSMLLNFRTLVNIGRGKFNGSKIFYCVFVVGNGRSFPLNMAKNIAAAKGMVLFGCESFKELKGDKINVENMIKAKCIGDSTRDFLPLTHKNITFPLRLCNENNK